MQNTLQLRKREVGDIIKLSKRLKGKNFYFKRKKEKKKTRPQKTKKRTKIVIFMLQTEGGWLS